MSKRKVREETDHTTSKEEMNLKRELFCRYYTQNDELFGNATLSYAEAFTYKLDELPVDDQVRDEDGRIVEESSRDKAYHVCSVMGHRLLRNADVQKRVTILLNELLTDDVVDGELAKVIKQNGKLEPKVAAIKEYNKLRARIVDQTKITLRSEKLDIDDLRAIISVLPQARQDEFYATINTIIAEAEELRRVSTKVQEQPAQ